MTRQPWTDPGDRFDRDYEREETRKNTAEVIIFPACHTDGGVCGYAGTTECPGTRCRCHP
jgi:hypothetical protein